MSVFRITDNDRKGTSATGEPPQSLLQKVENRTVDELNRDQSGIVVFPPNLDRWHDGIKDEVVLRHAGGKIYTGNVCGFLGLGGERIEIRSRFDVEGKNNLLQYMMSRVCSAHAVDLSTDSGQDSSLDWLVYAFPSMLQAALCQGVYRKYRRYERNDAHVHGVINVARHIRLNIPFVGKIAYDVREYSTDNDATQLVRHAIEHIARKNRSVLSVSDEMRHDVQAIREATPTYARGHFAKIIGANLRPWTHPYFTAWEPLRRLCLCILRNECSSFSGGGREVYGVLVNIAWLWEEYLATVLEELNLKHSENKLRKNGIPYFRGERGRWYPDFYDSERHIVVDAKYKTYGEKGREIDSSDVMQMAAYLHVLDAKQAVLIFPSCYKINENEREPWIFQGLGGQLRMLGLTIPNEASYDKFVDVIHKCEERVQRRIGKLSLLIKTENAVPCNRNRYILTS